MKAMQLKHRYLMSLGLATLSALSPSANATILTFTTENQKVGVYTSMTNMQDYGANVIADDMFSTNAPNGPWNAPSYPGSHHYRYDLGTGWTPDVTVHYSTQSPTNYPQYYGDSDGDTVWPGVCFLWSWDFDGGQGQPLGTKMPIGYEYYFTFTPSVANKGVVLNSFVLNDYVGYTAPSAPDQEVQWWVAKGTPSGAIVASGSVTNHDGEVLTINTRMKASQADGQPLVLVIKRMAGTEDDLAVDDINFDEVSNPPTLKIALNPGITVEGIAGLHYRVEYKDTVSAPAWSTLVDIASLPSASYQVFDPDPVTMHPERIYRVVLVP